jgi:hypothetical protein
MPSIPEPADMLSPAFVADLWRWSLQQLGLPSIHAPSADQFVAAFFQRPVTSQYPYPRYGLEVHFPDQAGRPHRVDLAWERLAPLRLRRATQMWQSPLVQAPGLQIWSVDQLEEMDFEDHQIKHMGVFDQISKQMPLARYQGPTLQRIAAVCGNPTLVGTVANRSAAVGVLMFSVIDRAHWLELIGILAPQVGEWLWAWRGLLDLLRADSEIFRLALLCDANGGILPRLGVEFSVIHPTPDLLQGLHQFELSSAALDAWAGLHRLAVR